MLLVWPHSKQNPVLTKISAWNLVITLFEQHGKQRKCLKQKKNLVFFLPFTHILQFELSPEMNCSILERFAHAGDASSGNCKSLLQNSQLPQVISPQSSQHCTEHSENNITVHFLLFSFSWTLPVPLNKILSNHLKCRLLSHHHCKTSRLNFAFPHIKKINTDTILV